MSGNTVYTRTGDGGRTQLVGGKKVSKADDRIECYGSIDELNATLGMALAALEGAPAQDELTPKLLRIQNELFNVGTQLATPDAERRGKLPDISAKHVSALEAEMDGMNEQLPVLRNFVLPGGNSAAACLHLSRTVCRRVERLVVRLAEQTDVDERHLIYLNRLSDALFVFARYVLWKQGLAEVLWEPEG